MMCLMIWKYLENDIVLQLFSENLNIILQKNISWFLKIFPIIFIGIFQE
jgi:hypothetical protein